MIEKTRVGQAGRDPSCRSNIVLIGMPGVGKSTVGVLLAKRMRMAFLDTDIIIQTRTGRTLQQIIQSEGVDRFRKLEAQYILDLDVRNHVIATGGSVVYSSRAMAHMECEGVIVFLDLGLEKLKRRLGDLDGRGVVRMPGQRIDDIFAERLPLYRQYSGITIACGRLTPDQVKELIVSRIEDHLSDSGC